MIMIHNFIRTPPTPWDVKVVLKKNENKKYFLVILDINGNIYV